LGRYIGDNQWHERCVLSWVTGSEFVIATPDLDLYIEQLDLANDDLDAVRFPADGAAPIGVPAHLIYGFVPRLAPAGIAALIVEGERMALLERAHRGLPVLTPPPLGAAAAGVGAGQPVLAAVAGVPAAAFVPVVAQPAAVAPVLPAVVPVAAVVPPGPGLHRFATAAGMWVLDEPMPRREVGDEVTMPLGAVNVGGRSLVSLDGSAVVIRFLPNGADVTRYIAARRLPMTLVPSRCLSRPSRRASSTCAEPWYTRRTTRSSSPGHARHRRTSTESSRLVWAA
jgi:hypothetical protein